MIKPVLLSLFLGIVITLIFSSTVDANFPLLHLAKLFETSKLTSKLRGAPGASGNLCCLPRTFSMYGDYSYFTPNSIISKTLNGTSSFFGDYKSGKIRQEVSNSPTGQPTPHILFTFRLSGSQYVNYDVMNNQCECVKYQYDFDWFCLPNQGNITKVTIGSIEGKKIVTKSQQTFMESFIFNDNPSQKDNCWILSTYSQDSFGNSIENMYNMVEKVDPAVFNLPDFCPPLEKCQSG